MKYAMGPMRPISLSAASHPLLKGIEASESEVVSFIYGKYGFSPVGSNHIIDDASAYLFSLIMKGKSLEENRIWSLPYCMVPSKICDKDKSGYWFQRKLKKRSWSSHIGASIYKQVASEWKTSRKGRAIIPTVLSYRIVSLSTSMLEPLSLCFFGLFFIPGGEVSLHTLKSTSYSSCWKRRTNRRRTRDGKQYRPVGLSSASDILGSEINFAPLAFIYLLNRVSSVSKTYLLQAFAFIYPKSPQSLLLTVKPLREV